MVLKKIIKGLLCLSIAGAILLPAIVHSAERNGSQDTDFTYTGRPIVQSYNPEAFGGESTNWYLDQDKDGYIYLGNGNGLFRYDGVDWKQLTPEGLTDVRQFVIDGERIWLAASGDFGSLQKNSKGDWSYESRLTQLSEENKLVSDFNNVYQIGNKIYFVCAEQIILLEGKDVLKVIKPTRRFSRAWKANDRLFFNDGQSLYFIDPQKNPILPQPTAFDQSKNIRSFSFVIPFKQGFLVGTYQQGIFYWHGDNISVWKPADDRDSALGFYNAISIKDRLLAIATLNGGVIFLDDKGNTLYRINNKNELESNLAVNLFKDKEDGLWIPQEGYLNRIQLPMRTSVFSGKSFGVAKVRNFIRVNNDIWLAAINGVKKVTADGKILDVESALRSSADLLTVGDSILIAGATGCQSLDPESGESKLFVSAHYCKDIIKSSRQKVLYISEKGIGKAIWKKNQWHDQGILIKDNQIASAMVRLDDGSIWTANATGKIYRIDKSDKVNAFQTEYENITLLSDSRNIYLATNDGLLRWDVKQQTTRGKVNWYHQQFGNNAPMPHLLNVDQKQRLWVGAEGIAGYFELTQGEPTKWHARDALASQQKSLRSVFVDNQITWLGFNSGVARINEQWLAPAYRPRLKFSSLVNSSTKQQVNVENVNLPVSIDADEKSRIFRLYFSLLEYLHSEQTRYRYRINGEQWSEWNKENFLTLNLDTPGNVKIEVAAKDYKGSTYLSSPLILNKAPLWYQQKIWQSIISILALLIIGLLVWSYNHYRTRQLIARQKLLEEEVQKRTRVIEQQAQKLSKLMEAKDRFFANVSHEFRTPLTLALGPLKATLDNYAETLTVPVRRNIDIAIKNCRQMMYLVGQILDVNKLEWGEVAIHAEKLNLQTVLEDTLNRYSNLAAQKDIQVHLQPGTVQSEIYFDPMHLDKIIANLLSNAFKFSPEHGQLWLSLDSNEKEVILTVTDQGPGIAKSDQSSIFKRYYQGKVQSMLQPGTGIGLSIVKELLELHGGTVALDPEYSRGARFIVTFKTGKAHFTAEQLLPDHSRPSMNQTGEAVVDVELSGEATNVTKAVMESMTDQTLPHVLIVDDNHELRYFIRESLGSNYHITEAQDGNQALTIINSAAPDMIVSDIMMSGMDGLQLTQILKQNKDTAHIPLLLLTAKSTKRETVEGLQAGADDYMSKPFDSSELAARIDAHLKQKRHVAQAIYAEYRSQASGAVVSQFESADSKFERSFVELIDQHLPDPDINVDWLVQQLHVERSTLFRRVQKIFSCTPNQYIRRRRLEVACQLLADKKGTVSEVAYAVGFQSLSYFSRCFSQIYQKSPTEYLKSA